MKRLAMEELCGLILLLMVFLAAKYGSVQVVSAQAQKKEQPVVVVDVGHGGRDPGKVGIDGSLEKDVNLAIALKLKTYLEQSDVKVVMTRETDTALYGKEDSRKKMADMKARCRIIEESDADLVVSIHQNSYSDPEVKGPQVFYYEHSAQGEELAVCIQEQLNQQLEVERPRQVKGNSTYYLLKRSEGVLNIVECGFLTNPQEAELLQTKEYQKRIAGAIKDGIVEYLQKL